MISLTKVQAASFLPGLQDLGSFDSPFSIGTVTIPANSNTTRSFVVTFSRIDVISMLRVNFSGMTNISGIWIPIFGPTLVNDTTLSALAGTTNYAIYVTLQSHPQGRQINLQFINETVGAPVTTPSLTLNVHAHLYAYPWE